MVKVGILQQKRAELCPPYLLHCRALRLKALGTTTVKSARVVGPTPWTQLPQPQTKTGRSQGSSPALLGVPSPVARTPPQVPAQVPLEAPVPNPASWHGNSACASCGPVPKPKPKAKSRKESDTSSQPKLAQFFAAQTGKASTCSNTSLAGPSAPAQVFPKSPPGSSLSREPFASSGSSKCRIAQPWRRWPRREKEKGPERKEVTAPTLLRVRAKANHRVEKAKSQARVQCQRSRYVWTQS